MPGRPKKRQRTRKAWTSRGRVQKSWRGVHVRVKRRVVPWTRNFTFNRKFKQDILVTNQTNPQQYAMQWKLVDLPNNSEFTNLFDVYKINYVDITFIYDHNSGDIATSTGIQTGQNLGLPNIYLARDYDDADPLPSLDAFLEYEGTIIKRLGNSFTVRVYPHIAVAAYGSGAFTSYKNDRSNWIDCTSNGVAHYGLKMAIDASMCNPTLGTAVSIGRLTIIHSFNLSFKCVR